MVLVVQKFKGRDSLWQKKIIINRKAYCVLCLLIINVTTTSVTLSFTGFVYSSLTLPTTSYHWVLVLVLFTGGANILWPGLNTPVIRGREVMTRKQLPPNPERSQEIIRMRDQMSRIRYPALPPLLRGFSGNRFPGQSIGPPDPVGDCESAFNK